MSKTTIIILILLALGVFIYVMKQKATGSNKTQDDLLNEMSRDELIDLVIALIPAGMDAAQVRSDFQNPYYSDDFIRSYIKKLQKPQNG